MTSSKSFKIVKIVDNYRVVINGGTTEKLHIGDELEVYVVGTPVIDPDTNDNLGSLDPIKAYLRIVHVYPNICICENSEREKNVTIEETNSLTQIVAGLQNFKKYIDTPSKSKPLNVNEEQISGGWIGDYDLQINLGDLVRAKQL